MRKLIFVVCRHRYESINAGWKQFSHILDQWEASRSRYVDKTWIKYCVQELEFPSIYTEYTFVMIS